MARKRRKVSNKQSSGKSKVGITLTSTGVGLLNEMAQKAGLSKSQLVEQFARGYVALASTTAQKTITLESSETDTNQQTESKTIIEVVNSPEQGQEVREHISSEEYKTLQEEVEAKNTHILELEQQLQEGKQNVEARHNQTNDLEKQLSEGKEELEAKISYIAELEKQLQERKEEIETKNNCIAELEQQLNQQKAQNQDQQIAELEKRLFQQRTQATRQAKNYRELKKQINTKDRQITLLKSQMADLQRLAAIGEAQLNKWRDRHFNS